MKKFVMQHIGFDRPTPEVMQAWGEWFESIQDQTVENVGLMAGREVTKDGTKALPWGLDSVTGYTVVQAESIDEAEAMARACPSITSIRVYEVREG